MFKPTILAISISACLFPSSHSFAQQQQENDIREELETIVVSATRTEKPLKDVAGSISVITSEDIENQSVSDMNQLFKYDPSVQVTGQSGGAQNIIVRGMGSDRVLMIKDGMRMNEGYGANGLNDIVGRGFIETDTLKQVEIAKGAASSLYGSDALAGIVVFTTKDASDYLAQDETFAANLKTGYTNLTKQTHVALNLALRTGEFEQLINVSLRDGKEEKNYHKTQSPFDIESQSILYKAKYNLNEQAYINFSADIWQQKTLGQSANGLLAYFRDLAQYGYHITTENSQSDKDAQAFKLSYHSENQTYVYDNLNINIYHNSNEQADDEYALLDINAPMFGVIEKRDMWKKASYQQQTLGFLSNATKELNNFNTLGFGLDIESTNSTRTVHEYREVAGAPTKDLITNKFPETDTLRAGLFINDEIKLLSEQLIITPGIRLDIYKMDPNGALQTNGEKFEKSDKEHLSVNLGALYKLNDEISLFAQYGQGFKVPDYDLAYIEHYNQPSAEYIYQVIPSENLSPEQSDSYELGIRGQIGDLAFTSAFYYNQYDNFLDTELKSRETVIDENGQFSHIHDTYQYQNIDSVTIKGAEFGVTYYATDAMYLFANAAYQNGKDDTTDEYITSISPFSGVLGLNYEFNIEHMGNISTDLVLNWADKMNKVNENKAEISGFGAVDWMVNYRVSNDLKVNLVANNIFDKEYVLYNAVAGHAEGEDQSRLAEAGRSFSIGMKYSF